MGTWIYLHADFRNVTQDLWESVYEETLDLVNVYPFMDRVVDKTTYRNTFQYVDRARERYLAPRNPDKLGWYVIGDMETLEHAESFMLFRDVSYWKKYWEKQNTQSGTDEVLFSLINGHIDIHPEITATNPGALEVFESKTQSYDYHTYILAICCLIEDRLKPYAVTGGDITLGQIKKSVDWANQHLKKAIALPDRCNYRELAARIAPNLKSEVARLEALLMLSLYPEGPEVGDFIREAFNHQTIVEYWKMRAKAARPGTYAMNNEIDRYLNMNFSMEDLRDIFVVDDATARHIRSRERYSEPDSTTVSNTMRRGYPTFSDVITWKNGSALHPVVENNTRVLREFCDDLQDELHRDFAETPRKERIETLLMYNQFFFICKETWDFVFEKIEDDNVYCRILALLQVHADDIHDSRMLKCIFCNLAFLKHFFLEDAAV